MSNDSEQEESSQKNCTSIAFNSSSPFMKQIFTAKLRAEPCRLEKFRDFGEIYNKFLHTNTPSTQRVHSTKKKLLNSV